MILQCRLEFLENVDMKHCLNRSRVKKNRKATGSKKTRSSPTIVFHLCHGDQSYNHLPVLPVGILNITADFPCWKGRSTLKYPNRSN